MTIIDIHSHLLPKVDDSKLSRWKFDSMMARYKDAGISHLVFTPHIGDPYVVTKTDKIQSTFEWAREKAAKRGVETHLGCEYYVRGQDDMSYIPMFGTHVLCETDTTFEPQGYLDTVRAIRAAGHKVILAHVERYRFLTPESELFQMLREELGCLVQVNAEGARGERGRMWLKSGVVDILATDNHGREELPLALYEVLGQWPQVARRMAAFADEVLA